jgi:hypothetical protein
MKSESMRERQDVRLIELIHELTQKGWKLTFQDDFQGMVTVGAWADGEFINHWHIGTPGGSMKDLERDVRNLLAGIEEEK